MVGPLGELETNKGHSMIDQHYIEELRLSRELANAIAQEYEAFGQVVPHSVLQAYKRLVEHYQKEQEEGVQ